MQLEKQIQSLSHTLIWIQNQVQMQKNDFKKKFFQGNEKHSFWKNYGKYKKTFRLEACDNRSKKKLSVVRTKVLYNKFLVWEFISNRNEKTQIFMNK